MASEDIIRRIFTQEDFRRVREAQRRLHDLIPVCEKARAAGMQVDAFNSFCDGLRRDLEAIEQNFMGHLSNG